MPVISDYSGYMTPKTRVRVPTGPATRPRLSTYGTPPPEKPKYTNLGLPVGTTAEEGTLPQPGVVFDDPTSPFYESPKYSATGDPELDALIDRIIAAAKAKGGIQKQIPDVIDPDTDVVTSVASSVVEDLAGAVLDDWKQGRIDERAAKARLAEIAAQFGVDERLLTAQFENAKSVAEIEHGYRTTEQEVADTQALARQKQQQEFDEYIADQQVKMQQKRLDLDERLAGVVDTTNRYIAEGNWTDAALSRQNSRDIQNSINDLELRSQNLEMQRFFLSNPFALYMQQGGGTGVGAPGAFDRSFGFTEGFFEPGGRVKVLSPGAYGGLSPSERGVYTGIAGLGGLTEADLLQQIRAGEPQSAGQVYRRPGRVA